MKIYNHIVYMVIAFTIYSFAAYTQNNIIDSLKKVLKTQKEDTNKVNTLNELLQNQFQFFQDAGTDVKHLMHYATEALYLSEKTNFKKGKGDAYFNIAW